MDHKKSKVWTATLGGEGNVMESTSKFWRIGIVIFLVVVLLLAGCSSKGDLELDGEEETVRISGGTEGELREFVKRLFDPRSLGFYERSDIFVGTLPDDLPISLILPEGAEIIGSYSQDGTKYIDIFFDTGMSEQEVIEYFTNSLRLQGILPLEQVIDSIFVTRKPPVTFCGEGSLNINLWFYENDEGITGVELTIENDEIFGSPCDDVEEEYVSIEIDYDLIPLLVAPAGTFSIPYGGVYGSDSMHETISLETELNVEELTLHFASQLKEAGWQQIDENHTELVSWTAWSRTDEGGYEWVGVLTISPGPNYPEEKFVTFQAERKP